MRASILPVVTITAALLLPLEGAERTNPDAVAASAIDEIVARAGRPPVHYRALRRLEVTSAKMSGWLEALTEFDPVQGFHYSVIAEGGSSRVRNSVLRAILETEQKSTRPDEARRGAFSFDNYRFQPAGPSEDGTVKLLLVPRRKDSRLVDGALFVSAGRGDLVRVEGQLAKSPSFWVRHVHVAWRYEQIGEVAMPVEVRSDAQVKVIGLSTLLMTYQYEMVDGRLLE